MYKLLSFILTCAIFLILVNFVDCFNLVIIHTNDIHAHIEEMNQYTSACSPSESQKGQCYGGISRRVTKINEIRSKYNNVILLDGGDQYQGSLWFNIFKGREAALFMNKLKYDAMTFGNHEFDNGVSGLVPFLENITFPILSCTLDVSREPRLQGKFNKSTILNVNGQKIGVVGYITAETSFLSNADKTVTFLPVVEAVRQEVELLKQQGIKIIIGLGHYGYSNDKKLAAEVDGLDVIVGGHSHTFLYTGQKPSNDDPEGPYPTIVQAFGRTVLVTQAFWAGKYLGFVNVTFNDEGDIESWIGEPILLNSAIAKDPETEALLDTMRPRIDAEKKVIVGYSAVYLEGDRTVCRLQECNLGNLITDSMVSYHAARHTSNVSWTDMPIAIMNSGGIRGPISQGNISKGDVLTTMPFGNTVDVITIKGKILRAALEHSVENYDPLEKPGAFLQVSGLRITYDLCKKPGSRVVSVYTRCGQCLIPSYKPLNDDKNYTVIALNFIIKGGDGYTVIRDNLLNHYEYNSVDSSVFISYLETHQPIVKGLEGRITLLADCPISSARRININALYIVFSLLFFITKMHYFKN